MADIVFYNKPMGIVLCTDKSDVSVEYALYEMDNNILCLYIPKKEELQD